MVAACGASCSIEPMGSSGRLPEKSRSLFGREIIAGHAVILPSGVAQFQADEPPTMPRLTCGGLIDRSCETTPVRADRRQFGELDDCSVERRDNGPRAGRRRLGPSRSDCLTSEVVSHELASRNQKNRFGRLTSRLRMPIEFPPLLLGSTDRASVAAQDLRSLPESAGRYRSDRLKLRM